MALRFAERATSAYTYPLLIRHLLHTPLLTAADQVIVYRDQSRYTYRDLSRRIHRLAVALAGLGVEQGTTVAVMDWDSHRYLECFFAIPMMGAVLQMVNVRLSPTQIAYTLRHAGAEVLLVHAEFVPLLTRIRSELPKLRQVVLIADGQDAPPLPDWIREEYERLVGAADETYVFEDFDENAVATTFYTTGTTGEPKGVCFTHRQLVLHTLAVMGVGARQGFGQAVHVGDVYMPLTPMFHVHAWGNPYVATLLGLKQVFPGRYVPEELVSLRAREGVTWSHCVPTVLQMILAAATRMGADLSGWKFCVGGAALPPGLAAAALERGIDVYAGYGLSETAPVLSITRLTAAPGTLPLDAEIERRCRTGVPLPLVDLRIVNADMTAVAHDDRSVGELVVRTPWATTCYVGNPEASEALWAGGYLHTQDVARIDPQGFIQITDRMKDVIKTGGEWLSSLELEALISQHPAVAEVAVIGVADPQWGERPHVLVVPRDPSLPPAVEEIRAVVADAADRGLVPRYAVPERVTLVSALERTSVGKINKRALRERYGAAG
jgi:fatty-acyl-CoA synthase